MSSAVFFLLLAVGLMILGSVVLWLTHRKPPMSDDRSVDDFARNLRALDPESLETQTPAPPRRPSQET
ncbi:MAG: hypothetical protein ACR2QE_15455 [Acidimicrobiales bacterium]